MVVIFISNSYNKKWTDKNFKTKYLFNKYFNLLPHFLVPWQQILASKCKVIHYKYVYTKMLVIFIQGAITFKVKKLD